MNGPQPFTIEWSDAAIADLRERLARTRWPEAETVDDWSQGVPLAYLREVCEYWADGYDFAAAQARLNRFPQFRTEVDGLGIHFLHLRSPHADALPLVLTHGWPGSVVEFLDVIGPLTDPRRRRRRRVPRRRAVAARLRLQRQADDPGWNIQRIARAWDTLMPDLGYDRYGAQGGDWGAMVTTSIGQQCADHVAGIHVNMPVVNFGECDMTDLTEQESAALARVGEHADWGMGYSAEQSTRPQTLGYGLIDSAGRSVRLDPREVLGVDRQRRSSRAGAQRDQMLDNISLYWFTADRGVVGAPLLGELQGGRHGTDHRARRACSSFPKEILGVSERWARTRFTDLRWYRRARRGRTLRRVRAARALRRRGARLLPHCALTSRRRASAPRRISSWIRRRHRGGQPTCGSTQPS